MTDILPLDLAAQSIGQGPPVVILHGLFGSQRNWGGISRALSDTHTVHGLDLRNHGESPWHAMMSYEAMAIDVAHYIEKRGLAPVTLLGHSMGGKTAMRLALSRPDLVERLLVIDIAPTAYQNESHGQYVAAMMALPLAQLTRRADADALLTPAIPDASLRAFLMQNLISDQGQFRWRLNLADILANMAAIIGWNDSGETFDGPTFFVAGERSNYIRPRDLPVIERDFPKARMFEISEAGHWPHAEFPDRFLSTIRPLLSA